MELRYIMNKYTEFILTKIKILYSQRIFENEGVCTKYILKKDRNSEVLVVVFSACTRKGIKARYNYVKTLSRLECNRLHILDDHAPDGRGSYYLGKNYTFCEERATWALIEKTIQELTPKKVIFCGSSKGGYAALNFGLRKEGAYIIAGGPQYHLADYLNCAEDNSTYCYIVGENSPAKESELNGRLRTIIESNQYKATQKIYIHYSEREHTYLEHICDLLLDLKKNGYVIAEDVADYEKHSDISYYFPTYLVKTISQIIGE